MNTNKYLPIFIALLCLIFHNLIKADIQITLNPGQVAFQKVPNSDYYDAVLPVQVSIQSNEPNWTLNLLASPLTMATGQITTDRMFVNHDLSGGVYQNMNTTILIGSGGITSGIEIINTLHFRIEVLDTDPVGVYTGQVQIQTNDQVYTALLDLILDIQPYLNFSVNSTDLLFEINGPPGIYDANVPIKLAVNGNQTNWEITCNFINLQGPNGALIPRNAIFVNSTAMNYNLDDGAGIGYMILSFPREIITGNIIGNSGLTTLNFRINTQFNYDPGTYNGSLKIDCQEFPNPININLTVNVSEYLYIQLSNSIINVVATSLSGIYDGDKTLSLKIASNSDNWKTVARGSDLTTTGDNLPKERLFLKSSQIQNIVNEGAGIGYMSLVNDRTVAYGGQTTLKSFTNLDLRVKITPMDIAGDYSGSINFIVVSLP